jgi:hypothetical protein
VAQEIEQTLIVAGYRQGEFPLRDDTTRPELPYPLTASAGLRIVPLSAKAFMGTLNV